MIDMPYLQFFPGTYLEPMISHLPSDEYECVHNPNAPYMELDVSSQQPASVYQEVTNPENLKHSDTYLALDPKSRSAETEYQAIDPRGRNEGATPAYATSII